MTTGRAGRRAAGVVGGGHRSFKSQIRGPIFGVRNSYIGSECRVVYFYWVLQLLGRFVVTMYAACTEVTKFIRGLSVFLALINGVAVFLVGNCSLGMTLYGLFCIASHLKVKNVIKSIEFHLE